jgi:hypothetical protein
MSDPLENPYAAPVASPDSLQAPEGRRVSSPVILGGLTIFFVSMRTLVLVLYYLGVEDVSRFLPFEFTTYSAFAVISGIFTMLWTYQCARNAQRVEPRNLEPGPGLIAFSYIIPFYNLFGPYVGVKRISEITFRNSPSRQPPRGLLLPWWITWIGTNILNGISNRSGNVELADVAFLSYLIAAGLFITVVFRLTLAQRNLRIPPPAIPIASDSPLRQVMQPRSLPGTPPVRRAPSPGIRVIDEKKRP